LHWRRQRKRTQWCALPVYTERAVPGFGVLPSSGDLLFGAGLIEDTTDGGPACDAKPWLFAMLKNGLYSVVSKLLDGVEGGPTGVSVLRDGTMRGGGSIYYHVGSYVCSGGKWKGELTIREHTPAETTRVFAGKVVSMGFTGTYTDDDAEFHATALAGKRSVQMKVVFRLLTPD
jgi:T3SS negative regulator,GrlR